ncbi:MAG: DUF2461 domain-containing protein [Calditrichaeota bacterium]|nr:MAG: DUF2461 domain-containing protein [Calditrichota bacterium]
MATSLFPGFPKECITFFSELAENNNKPWFDEHKSEYEEFVQTPAREFVVAMGEKLKTLVPDIHADPRVNKSLFRIHRDTRFSKDKTPYKTNLALWFWQGDNPSRVENSGFYFSLTRDKLMLGGGAHTLGKEALAFYRDYVTQPSNGDTLLKLTDVLRQKGYNLGEPHYKRVPRGYDPDSKYAHLLLYNGCPVFTEMAVPDALLTPEIIDLCFEKFQDMHPLQQWVAKMLQAVR